MLGMGGQQLFRIWASASRSI